MQYGHPPFGRIQNIAIKIQAILYEEIKFEESIVTIKKLDIGNEEQINKVKIKNDQTTKLIEELIRNCLNKDPKQRATIDQMLFDEFLL